MLLSLVMYEFLNTFFLLKKRTKKRERYIGCKINHTQYREEGKWEEGKRQAYKGITLYFIDCLPSFVFDIAGGLPCDTS